MLKKAKEFIKSILGRVYLGYFLLLLAFVISMSITYILINSNRNKIVESTLVINPTIVTLYEMKLSLLKLQTIIQKQVKSPLKDKEKIELISIFQQYDKKTKPKLKNLSEKWLDVEIKKLLDTTITYIDSNFKYENQIKLQLNEFEDYNDPFRKFSAEDIFENNYNTNSYKIDNNIVKLIQNFTSIKETKEGEIQESEQDFLLIIIISSVIVILFGIIFSNYIVNNIKSKLGLYHNVVENLSTGKIKNINLNLESNELGEMGALLEKYVTNLKKTTEFADAIGKGNFNVSFKKISEDDLIGETLLKMRENLKSVKDNEAQRNWVNHGNAIFAELLRNTSISAVEICDLFLTKLVKYTNSNQGTIYLLKNINHETYFQQISAYAYDRKKIVKGRIELHEGLVGQCYDDNDKIYITDIPEEYIKIKSGLGDSSPKCILLVPIRHNNEIIGIIELTTFNPYLTHEVEFIEKLGETLGVTLSTVFTNETTKILLEESQKMEEQLRSQEEEMRQNMEELMATQEELQNKNYDINTKIEALNHSNIINVVFSPKGIIQEANDTFLKSMKIKNPNEIIGKHHKIFVDSTYSNSEEYKMFWNDLGKGIYKSGDFKRRDALGNVIYLRGSYYPIKNKNGNVEKVIKFGIDITELFAKSLLN